MFKILKDLLFGRSKQPGQPFSSTKLKKSLAENIKLFQEIFSQDETINYRYFTAGINIQCCIIYAKGLIKKGIISRDLLRPCMDNKILINLPADQIIKTLVEKVIDIEDTKITDDIDSIVDNILYGDTLLLVDGANQGIIANSKGWTIRSVSEAKTEGVVRGPREGFVECLMVNISFLRRRINSRNLKFEFMEVGQITKTKICICYIKGLTTENILRELRQRLKQIDIDGILESGYIEEMIRDSPFSPFLTVGNSERPDVVAGKLLEGRVAILCDGTPFVLTIPFLFIEIFQANEDYYKNFYFASLDRILRYVAYFFTTSVPAIYVALVTFHQEMIPTPLLLSIAASREGVPFPTIIEAVILGLFFELLREGGTRLPTPIGEAVSIVGAIILGEAAVTAKLVSSPMIVITAITGIASFLIPLSLGSIIIIRLILILLASVLGLYGYMFGLIGIFIHLMSIRSFGVPYMSSMDSLSIQDLKDTLIRAPWWYMYLRPKILGRRNRPRQPTKKLRRANDET